MRANAGQRSPGAEERPALDGEAEADMPVPWRKKPGPAPWLANLGHGLWQVSVPDRTSGAVELAYVRRSADGRLPGIPLVVGSFSGEAEAMLAAETYEGGTAPGPVADLAAARGFAGRGSELVLALPDGDECVLAVGPEAVSLRIVGTVVICIGRMRRPRLQDGFTAFEHSPGVEDPEALGAAALLDIFDIRHARGPSELRKPVTMSELETWRRTHCLGRPAERPA